MNAATQHHFNFSHFAHLTIDTGHCSSAHSNSVTSDVRNHFAPLVARALDGGEAVPVELVSPDTFMRIKSDDGAFYVEMLARSGTSFSTVVAFGISLTPGQGNRLWQQLHAESLFPQTSVACPPQKPWIAARLTLEAANYLDIILAAGEFERSIAWTLATHVAQGHFNSVNNDGHQAEATRAAKKVEAAPVPPSDGVVFNCHKDCGPTLTVYLSSPSDQEIQDIRRGEARFAIATHRDVSFMLLKFGGLDWMDAPFHAGLYAAALRGMPREWRPGTRLALAVVIVDRDTGRQCGARLLSLSPHFWDALAAQVNRQASSPISRGSYDSAIDAAYRVYSTPRAMVKHALATSKAGD